ncbi:MAG: hypothetical protein ABI600_12940 [Luteolibacter sp.]
MGRAVLGDEEGVADGGVGRIRVGPGLVGGELEVDALGAGLGEEGFGGQAVGGGLVAGGGMGAGDPLRVAGF